MKTYFSFFVWIAVEVRSVQLITFLDPLLSAMPVHHYQSLCHRVASGIQRTRTPRSSYEDDHTWYRSLIGRLNWLAVETRPDIKFAVIKLQRRTASPTVNDMQVRQVYRYLKATTELCITLGKVADTTFFAYADASHGDWNDAKSTEGAIWFFGGAPIRCYARK
jgi:hypothetical protein